LRNVFSRVKEWKLFKHNPVESGKKPRVEYNKTYVYTIEEVHELFRLLENEVIHRRLIVTLAIICGMRRSEILELQWEDVDFETNTIHVRHATYN
jgi:integrase